MLIVISRSGASKQAVQAMELARRVRMHMVVISGSASAQFTEHADCVLRIADKGKRSMATAEPDSQLCELAVSDALLYVVRNLGALTKNIEHVLNNSTDEVELLLSEYKL